MTADDTSRDALIERAFNAWQNTSATEMDKQRLTAVVDAVVMPLVQERDRLAAEKAKWQVEAWDEGYSAGLDYMSPWLDGDEDEPENPYEKGTRR